MLNRRDSDRSLCKQVLLLLAVSLLGVTSMAQATLPNSELGLWLKKQASPQLLELIGQHPRFKGERISVVSMQDRKPSTRGHALGRTLEEYLTHRLLSQSQASITWRDKNTGCRPIRSTPYLLGIEVQPKGRNQAAVTVAIVDVEENIWVPGASLRWQGKLTSAERRALGTVTKQAANGSIERPLAWSEQDELLQRLVAQLQCAMPTGIDGSIYIAPAGEDPTGQSERSLVALTEQLRLRLKRSPLFELTDQLATARWQAVLQTSSVGSNTRLDLNLVEAGGDGSQRLAALHIEARSTDAIEPASVAKVPTPTPSALPDVGIADEPLLSALEEIDIAPCPLNSNTQCLQVELALRQPAWLLTFRSQDGTISGQSCTAASRRSKAATRRYRVTLDEHDSVGFYALATTDPKVARRLAKALRTAPGNCNRKGKANPHWLETLTSVIEQHQDAIHWRATHLASDSELAMALR